MGSRRLTLAAAFPPIAATVGLAALAAGAVATHLPGAGREAILKTHGHGSTITQVLSPLVDIRARIRQQSDQEWFTVASSDGPHYWRMTALTTFDGNQWLPASEELVARGDLSDRLPGTRSDQVITITGMRGHLVPAAFLPAKVSGGSIRWAAGSETLVQTGDELAANQTITISSRVPQLTPVRLRQATSAGVAADYKQLPLDLSDSVRATAVAVSAGASSNYDKAIALQSWFRDNFTYDLNVPSGESDDAISAFLRERRGFCQQFSVAFAVMARSLGIPARVAVGFTQGDLGSDGLYHVYGRHAHAWPEVWFDGFGWVAFEPTPGRGNPDTSGYTGVAPAQDDTRGGGNGGQPSAVSTPNTASTVPGKPAEGPGGTPTIPVGERTTVPVRKGAGRAGGIGSSVMALVLIGLLLLVVLWMLLAPRVVAALARRRAHSAPERVVAAWHRTCNALSLAGAPPVGGATPLEYAATAERAAGLPEQSVRELARQVTRVVYSPLGVGEADAAACESLEHDLDSMCRARTPLSLRLQALLDPRMMRRRATG
jgi:transglutaminase-like putative cysteine protease